MVKVSAAIITFNEEKNIKRCIDSLKSVADEIVIVDSYSTDKTVEIAQNEGTKVVLQQFLGHVEQKNFAITQCTYQYVISLDADEALSDELVTSILEVKQNWQFDGYSFNRLTNYCGKWIKTCGWYPDTKIRLFDKTKGSWQGTNPHDVFVIYSNNVKQLKGDILHYSFYTVEQHKKQIEYFTDIAAKAYFDEGRKSTFSKRYLSAIVKFIRSYFFQLGFIDGYYGFVISWLSAGAKYKKYKKLTTLIQYKNKLSTK